MIVVPSIRLATAKDAYAIAEMSRGQIEHGLGWSWTAPRVLRAIRHSSTNVVVAHETDELVGFGIMDYGESKAHLALLAVHPERRESGIGRRVLEWLETCARTAGLECIELEARADNPVALGFYALLGFERTGTVPGYYQGRIDALRLRKWLVAQS